MLFGILGLLICDVGLSVIHFGGALRTHAELQALKAQVNTMTTAFDNLKAAVAAQVSVDRSAVTLIQGIADKLKEPDADVQALADELTAASAPLAAAITANTTPTPTDAAPAAGGVIS